VLAVLDRPDSTWAPTVVGILAVLALLDVAAAHRPIMEAAWDFEIFWLSHPAPAALASFKSS
jgi:hypothetical protein